MCKTCHGDGYVYRQTSYDEWTEERCPECGGHDDES
jgi:DnaJ-class molecular chaperone